MSRLFDTHAHLISDDWNAHPPRPLAPSLPVPQRTDYSVTAETLVRMMDQHDVAVSCVVQRGHLYGYDNSYIIEAGRSFPGRLLPIVILDTQDPATPATLTRMVREQGVHGLRLANTRPSQLDTAWMASPAALRVWEACSDLQLPVAIIFFQNQLPWTLPTLRYIARRHPDLPILVDHLGIPWGASLPELAWARDTGIDTHLPPPPDFGIDATVRILEDTPNVFFKFTEINVERMQEMGIDPALAVRRMADVFGARRLMWGSDVGQSVKSGFEAKVTHAHAAARLLEPIEHSDFLHDTAARIYARR